MKYSCVPKGKLLKYYTKIYIKNKQVKRLVKLLTQKITEVNII